VGKGRARGRRCVLKLLQKLSGSGPSVDLAPRVEALERRLKAVELEWDEMYDQFRRLYAKLSKRISDAQRHDDGNGRGEIAPPPPDALREAAARAFARMGRGG
jgi:hypothetical protein